MSRFIDIWTDRGEPVITEVSLESFQQRLGGHDRRGDWVFTVLDRDGRPFQISWHSWGTAAHGCLSVLEE
ncbi:hypothetical protein [Streptomyces sp. NPDC086519]|uniref:hypothetical protein n=1 Tax=Streptomyces sp. NPDC086519 TaxID=3154863 RepID=UPI00342FF5FF